MERPTTTLSSQLLTFWKTIVVAPLNKHIGQYCGYVGGYSLKVANAVAMGVFTVW